MRWTALFNVAHCLVANNKALSAPIYCFVFAPCVQVSVWWLASLTSRPLTASFSPSPVAASTCWQETARIAAFLSSSRTCRLVLHVPHRRYLMSVSFLAFQNVAALFQCADDEDAVCTRSVTVSLPSLEDMTVKLKHGGVVAVNSMDIQTPMHHGMLMLQIVKVTQQ